MIHLLYPPLPEPRLAPRTPRKIHLHYVPIPIDTSPANPCRRLKAESHIIPEGTPYTLRGAWGCSAPHQPDVDLMVTIALGGWETHVVAGKDLL